MRPDPTLAGVFDPERRLDRTRLRALLEAALTPFGAVQVHDEGPLVAAAADPSGRRLDGARQPVLCLMDGYLEAEASAASRESLGPAGQAGGDAVIPGLRGAFAVRLWDRAQHRPAGA